MKSKLKRIFIWIVAISIILLIGYMTNEGLQIEDQYEIARGRYCVRVSSWMAAGNYYCDSYKKDGSTYYLYDKNGNLKNEITITDGYICTIKLNNGN